MTIQARALVVLALVFSPLSAKSDPPAELVLAWEDVANLDYAGALARFEALRSQPGPYGREARYGAVVAALNLPRLTNRGTEPLENELSLLIAESPSDEIGRSAAYFHARVPQVYRDPPDLEEAALRYAKVITTYPESLEAELSMLKLAALELTAKTDAFAIQATVTQWHECAKVMRNDTARRNLCRLLAHTLMREGIIHPQVVSNLRSADVLGFSRHDMRALNMFRLFQLELLAGNRAGADAEARRFIEAFPRSPWAEYLREHLTEEAKAAIVP